MVRTLHAAEPLCGSTHAEQPLDLRLYTCCTPPCTPQEPPPAGLISPPRQVLNWGTHVPAATTVPSDLFWHLLVCNGHS